ncbi:glycosyltransferase 87 family protein [Phaeacidiphilus oryzae]|uniref:glycosyltransferase 87 family protein n=1 Tax=Phaeacidiphilus oryzae TaxID=348818 RepID=UPI0007C6CB13|nr:glycosyltransferase 87 family protein [Phaeacidiphilus oryzae]
MTVLKWGEAGDETQGEGSGGGDGQPQPRPDRGRPDGGPSPAARLLAPLLAPVAEIRNALRDAPRRATLRAAGIAVLSLLAYFLVRHLVKVSMVDMVVYRAEGSAVKNGQDLYDMRVTQWNLPATYPPFAALLFTPTAWLPIPLLRVLVTGANVLLLGGFSFLSTRLADWPRRELRPVAVLLAAGLGVWLEPIWTTFRYGQVNLIIGCLVLWDLTRPDGHRGKGIGIGIAAGLKLTPGLFAVWLLLTGRVRAACTAAATGVGTMLVGWLLLPRASLSFWTKDIFDTSRVGKVWIVDNQSIRGVVCRFLHTTEPGTAGLVAAACCGVLGLGVAVGWSRYGARLRSARGEAWGAIACAVTALLISPISWSHHWVWVLPMIVLLMSEAAREARAPEAVRHLRWRVATGLAIAACVSFCLWIVPRKGDLDLHQKLWEQPFTAVYPLVGLAFLLLAGELLRRELRRVRGPWPGRPLLPHPRANAAAAGPAGPDRTGRADQAEQAEQAAQADQMEKSPPSS